MVILELCGLPGCGKSTLIDSITEKLVCSELRIATRNEIYFFNCKNKDKKLALLKTFLKLNNYGIYWKIFKINRKYSPKIKCIKYAVQLMMLISQIQEAEKSEKYDIAIMDEGILQYFSAQADNSVFTGDKRIIQILDIVSRKINNWKTIKCEVDIEVALNRIMTRKGSSNRFSASKDVNVLHKLLTERKQNLDYLCSFKCDYTLDMNMDISNNNINIVKCINQILGGRLIEK